MALGQIDSERYRQKIRKVGLFDRCNYIFRDGVVKLGTIFKPKKK